MHALSFSLTSPCSYANALLSICRQANVATTSKTGIHMWLCLVSKLIHIVLYLYTHSFPKMKKKKKVEQPIGCDDHTACLNATYNLVGRALFICIRLCTSWILVSVNAFIHNTSRTMSNIEKKYSILNINVSEVRNNTHTKIHMPYRNTTGSVCVCSFFVHRMHRASNNNVQKGISAGGGCLVWLHVYIHMCVYPIQTSTSLKQYYFMVFEGLI